MKEMLIDIIKIIFSRRRVLNKEILEIEKVELDERSKLALSFIKRYLVLEKEKKVNGTSKKIIIMMLSSFINITPDELKDETFFEMFLTTLKIPTTVDKLKNDEIIDLLATRKTSVDSFNMLFYKLYCITKDLERTIALKQLFQCKIVKEVSDMERNNKSFDEIKEILEATSEKPLYDRRKRKRFLTISDATSDATPETDPEIIPDSPPLSPIIVEKENDSDSLDKTTTTKTPFNVVIETDTRYEWNSGKRFKVITTTRTESYQNGEIEMVKKISKTL